jgi:hypothetical protein
MHSILHDVFHFMLMDGSPEHFVFQAFTTYSL